MPDDFHQPEQTEIIPDRYTPSPRPHPGASVLAPTQEEVVANIHRDTVALELAIPEAELCDRLLTAVKEAADRDAASINRLRTAVSRFTIFLRERGTTPEHVLVALKSLINNRSLVAIEPHTSDWTGYTLREQMSTWCIEEFFTKPGSAASQTAQASPP